ncbi:trypsin-like peptidase domain-containing protein [Kitasatospora sp. KL5]|uniref:VMAP-C domain-containing protein n=1 Tax=Kitasatospora sp. KL5 TaxID=3425125 RepID=UPI003D6DA92F
MRRHNPLSSLKALLEQCRVLVRGSTDGTGFFVSPGFVVSCAHVVGNGPGGPVQLHWAGADYEAVVRAASPGTSEWGATLYPYPDLAILEVVGQRPDHPCVWLDTELPDAGTGLTAVGFTDILERYTASERRADRLVSGGRTALQGRPLLELVADEINPGLSGGPVLSHAGGGVCAVVKATRLENSTMGGFGVPVDALRLLDPAVYRTMIEAHDRFHAVDARWHTLSDQVADGHHAEVSGARAMDRVLLGLLASLPDGPPDGSGAHRAAFLAAAPPGTPAPVHPLLARRDVYTELAALMAPGPDRIPHELAYCADLARTPALRTVEASGVPEHLRDQVLISAGRLGLGSAVRERLVGDRAPSSPVPSVIGRIRHSVRDRSLYHVMVWRYRSRQDIVPGAPESPALPLADALARLKELLPQQIDVMDATARPGLIELILPQEALDEDFAAWQLWPDSDWWTLGRRQHLVVRPVERHQSPHLHHTWTRRWQHLAGKAVGEALVCVCGRDRQYQAALDATFTTDHTLAALALAGSPRSAQVSEAYRVAIASGIPMMVWRRGTEPRPLNGGAVCGVPGRASCPDGAFLALAREALAGTGRDAMPERICALRNAALTDEGPGEHVGDRVVLLWDDPDRQIPRTHLAPAGPAEEGPDR